MRIIGQGGIKAHYGDKAVWLTPDKRVLQTLSRSTTTSGDPLANMYFRVSISSNGEDVNVAAGLLIFPVLAYSGGGGVTTGAFAVNGFTPSTSGIVYYELEIVDPVDNTIAENSEQAIPVTIGTSSYAFSLKMRSSGTYPDPAPVFIGGRMLYATSMPAASAGKFRWKIAEVSVNSGGFPYGLQQKHLGAIFASAGEKSQGFDFSASIA